MGVPVSTNRKREGMARSVAAVLVRKFRARCASSSTTTSASSERELFELPPSELVVQYLVGRVRLERGAPSRATATDHDGTLPAKRSISETH